MRAVAVVIVALLSMQFALATHSAEVVVVRPTAYDAATRTYTFQCTPPPGYNSQQYWTIRPDTPDLEASVYTSNFTLTYTFTKNVLYHIGCQVQNGSQLLRGDFHLDWRSGPNTQIPNIAALSTDGLSLQLQCTPPTGTTDYTTQWWLINYEQNTQLSQLQNQNTVSITVPHAGLWDITCGVYDRPKQKWTQWSLPIETFNQGADYVPSQTGCVPNEPCPWGNGTSVINTTNVTVNTTNTTTNNTNATNSTNSTQACYTNVQSMPVSCTGGTITQDAMSGCRTVVCGSLQVLACDKGAFFEMYKQTQSSGVKICLGTTCISDNGYAKSGNYPLCFNVNTTGNNTNTTNATNQTNATVQNISFSSLTPSATSVVITEPNSQQFSYTLSNPSSLATSSQWLLNGSVVAADTSSYLFSGTAGAYNITALVFSSMNNLSRAWTLIVTPASNVTNSTNATNTTATSVKLSIAPWFPQGRSYVFICNATGFTPTYYDFYFGNGNSNTFRTANNVYYTYPSAGNYTVTCTARNGTVQNSSTLPITVT